MNQQKTLGIEDGSNDRRYFTIIPNYILDHFTMWDREVYSQMKKISGEHGICWTSQKTLSKQCGMSVNRLKKSIKCLLDNGWIKDYGTKSVGTRGGNQQVNQYKVADLWKLNVEYYQNKGISPNDTPLPKDTQRGITDDAKGLSPGDDKEEPLLNKNPIILASQSDAEPKLNDLIELFKPVNPSYERIYANKTQRSALERMVKKHGADKITWIIQRLPITNKTQYAPTITTPYQLEMKLGDIIAFFQKKKEEQEKNKIPTL